MPVIDIIWDLPDDPDGNVQHIAEHGLVPSDVEHVLKNLERQSKSRTTGRPIAIGQTPSGESIVVVYEVIDKDTFYPVTAYVVED